jgi:SPP1 family phage portal protein
MFRLDLKHGLSGRDIGKIITGFNEALTRFERLNNYYDCKNNILERTMQNDKPNNRLAHGFCKYITNMATGYFMGRGIRFVTDWEENHLESVLDAEYTKDSGYELAKEASKCGIAFELLYINENSELRSKKFGAADFIPIYSRNVDEFLEGAIRIWTEKDVLGGGKKRGFAELYTDREIVTYEEQGETYVETERREHNFSDVPVIVYRNNEEQKGDYEDVITLIDAYDKAQSDTANDFEYFTDAYLVIIGAGGGFETGGGDDEDGGTRSLKNNRLMMLDKDGQAKWLVKEINDTATENYKTRLCNDIFFLAQVPALSDENFGNNVSGVAIKYKLIGLEELSIEKENKFRSAIKKKLKFVVEYINLTKSKNLSADDIEIKFDRNIIDNISEISEDARKLDGIVSRETLFGLLPFVDDPAEEAARVLEEKREDDREGVYLPI